MKEKLIIKSSFCCKWAKNLIGIYFILGSLLVVSCNGKKETEKLLKIKIENSDKVGFVDVKTNETLRYDKLIMFGKEVDRVFHAKVGNIGSLGVGISWKETVPPKTEAEEFTRVITSSGLEREMKYTLKNGTLTIDVP